MSSLPLGRLFDLVPIVEPIDLDTSQSGDQFSLGACGGVFLVFFTGVGAAGRDLTFTVKRHTDMSDGTGTTINLATISHPYYYVKKGSAATAVGVAAWTKSSILTDTDGAAVVLDDTEGETSALIGLPIFAADLGSGYSALSVSAVVAGGSGAKLGAVLAIPFDLNVQRTPANLASLLS